MAVGVTGARVNAGWAWSNTWATPASVTTGLYLNSTDGLDGGPELVDDDTFNQAFIGQGEAGRYAPLTPELAMPLRYEGTAAKWIAAVMGSPAAPTVVSSVAANSLVACSHVISLAADISKFLTLAIDEANYVLEVPTIKLRGFSIKVGDNGKFVVSFPAIGSHTTYDSTTNTNSTVGGVTARTLNTRVYLKDSVFRMNAQGGSALAAGDAVTVVRDIAFGMNLPLAGDDFAAGSDKVLEPETDGFAEFPVEITYGRMSTVASNSLATALKTAAVMKADLTCTGTYINSTTQRSMLFQWPALNLVSYKAVVAGHGQVRPTATFRAKLATTSPAGMAFVQPMRVTVVNQQSQSLFVNY